LNSPQAGGLIFRSELHWATDFASPLRASWPDADRSDIRQLRPKNHGGRHNESATPPTIAPLIQPFASAEREGKGGREAPFVFYPVSAALVPGTPSTLMVRKLVTHKARNFELRAATISGNSGVGEKPVPIDRPRGNAGIACHPAVMSQSKGTATSELAQRGSRIMSELSR
jgi:hypothetical protein